MASIEKQGGAWRVVWRVHGRRQRKSFGDDLAAAEAFKREVDENRKLRAQGIPVEQIAARHTALKPVEVAVVAYLKTLPVGKRETQDKELRIREFVSMSPALGAVEDLGLPEIAKRLTKYIKMVGAKQARRKNDVRNHIVQWINFAWQEGWVPSNHALRCPTLSLKGDVRQIEHRSAVPSEAAVLMPCNEAYKFMFFTMLRGKTVVRLRADDLAKWQDGYILRLRKGVVKTLPKEITIALADRLTPLILRLLRIRKTGEALFDLPNTDAGRENMLLQDLQHVGIRECNPAGLFNARTFRATGNDWAGAAGVNERDQHLLRLDLGQGDDRLLRWTYQQFKKQWPRMRASWALVSKWYDDQIKVELRPVLPDEAAYVVDGEASGESS